MTIRIHANDVVRDFPPGAFAAVMATGIVSLAANMLGVGRVAFVLFVLNIGLQAGTSAIFVVRLVRFPESVRADAQSLSRAPGFFTFVAGLCVLGVQCVEIGQAGRVASWLLMAAVGSLFVVFYGFFASRIVGNGERSIERQVDGKWLVAVVSLQGIAVLAMVRPGVLDAGFALGASLVGSALYVPLITFILYRLLFVPLEAESFGAPYWVNMGALAIATLAGSLISLHGPETPLFEAVLPFLQGATFLFWSVASAWIPLLLVLEIWRYGVGRVKWRYESSLWDIVFPLGMYAVATDALSLVLHVEELHEIARAAGWISLFVWFVVAWGAIRAGIRWSKSDGERG